MNRLVSWRFGLAIGHTLLYLLLVYEGGAEPVLAQEGPVFEIRENHASIYQLLAIGLNLPSLVVGTIAFLAISLVSGTSSLLGGTGTEVLVRLTPVVPVGWYVVGREIDARLGNLAPFSVTLSSGPRSFVRGLALSVGWLGVLVGGLLLARLYLRRDGNEAELAILGAAFLAWSIWTIRVVPRILERKSPVRGIPG